MENLNLKDESGDKKYFTQLPNMIVNHSTAYEQSLYWIMKRLAGEGGNCYASLNFLAKKMGVHKTTVSKTIAKLLERKWVKEVSPKKIKGGTVRQFLIIDLWPRNVKEYEGGARLTTKKGGANKDGSGAIIDGSGAESDASKSKSNIYNKTTVDIKNKQRLNDLKTDFLKKTEMSGRTKAQEEASAIKRPSGL